MHDWLSIYMHNIMSMDLVEGGEHRDFLPDIPFLEFQEEYIENNSGICAISPPTTHPRKASK